MNRLWILVPLLMPALAQADAPAAQTPEPIAYEFNDELIQGDLVRPDAEILHARRRTTRASLIDLRSSFVAELLVSVEDL